MAKVGQLYTQRRRRDADARLPPRRLRARDRGEEQQEGRAPGRRLPVQGEDPGPVGLVRHLRRRGAGAPGRHRRGRAPHGTSALLDPTRDKNLQAWLASAPRLIATWDPLNKIYRRSLVDLAALRFETGITPGSLPAAGLPWFMAVFGRDSVLTSFQALAFVPELAAATLRALAIVQARKEDPFRDAEPGKILHEIRLGELTAFEARPQSPYYGAADTTMLFLILLEEYERWTGDKDLARELEREARAALAWIDNYGDRDKDGYVEYERRMETGLDNQCWKDSWDSIAFADGTIAPTPRATCELQGYVYDAKQPLRASGARDLERSRAGREAGQGGRGAQAPLQPGLLDPRAQLLRARARRPEAQGRFADLEHRPPAVERNRRRGQGRQVRQAPDERRAVLGLGDPHHGLQRRVVQPDRVPRRHGVAARQLVHRLGDAALRLPGGGGPDLSRDPGGGRRVRRPAARGVRRLPTVEDRLSGRVPDRVQPPGLGDRRAAAGACARCLGLDSDGKHMIIDPAIPEPLGRIELLGIPGCWGRMDAFGRALHATED